MSCSTRDAPPRDLCIMSLLLHDPQLTKSLHRLGLTYFVEKECHEADWNNSSQEKNDHDINYMISWMCFKISLFQIFATIFIFFKFKFEKLDNVWNYGKDNCWQDISQKNIAFCSLESKIMHILTLRFLSYIISGLIIRTVQKFFLFFKYRYLPTI